MGDTEWYIYDGFITTLELAVADEVSVGTLNLLHANALVTLTGTAGDQGLWVADDTLSVGHVQLNAGMIRTTQLRSRGTASMDIAGGTLIVDGEITSLPGQVVAHGGDPCYALDFDYNGVTTTITAVIFVPPVMPPNPADGENYVNRDVVLSWTPGLSATSYDVYLGEDFNDVNDATPDSSDMNKSGRVDFLDLSVVVTQWLTDPCASVPSADLNGNGTVNMPDFATTAKQWMHRGIYRGNQTETTYDPCGLKANTIYYWRVDKISNSGTSKGKVWSFSTTGNFFYMGVYIYEYRIAEVAAEQSQDYNDFLETHLQILQNHNINAIYLGGTSQGRFAENLRLFKKYGMYVIPQLDFVYFNNSWSESTRDSYAQTAANFINSYADESNILAWSVKEEPSTSEIANLADYYSKILTYAPDATLHLLHNDLGAAQNIDPPDPSIVGTDRYSFWWTVSGGGYLASPSFALNWYHGECRSFYETAADRGAAFMLTVTQGGLMMPGFANDLATDPSPSDPALQAKILSWAEDGRMGWKKYTVDSVDYYNVWKYYRLPKNCTKALAWISVLEGAKLFFNWSYVPPTEYIINTDFEQEASKTPPSYYAHWYSLAGLPDTNDIQLEEFAQASEEIRKYERIITRMTKLATCPLTTNDARTYCNGFSFPELNGRVVVIQNSNVGSWPHNSRHFFNDSDLIYIDDNANFVDYVGFTVPKTVHFSYTNPSDTNDVWDIASGSKILPDGSVFEIGILPGSGVLLFVGPSTEAGILHDKMNFAP